MAFNERTKLLIDADQLASKSVAVFGLGGVGSFVAEALARSGVGHLILCDNDVVSESNINRQLIALHSTVGRKKTGVARERYLDINPELRIDTYDTFILPENAGAFFDGLRCMPDYTADCIDTVSGKLAIIEECRKREIPVISCMGTGNKLRPELFRIDDISRTSVCPLCKVMRRELKNRNITGVDVLYSTEEPLRVMQAVLPVQEEGQRKIIGSIATVPSVAGLMIANHIIKELVK